MQVGILVELAGGAGVHLDQGDAAAAPLHLRLVDREEGLEEQVHDALGDGLGVHSQAGQQVVHVAHGPELERPEEIRSDQTSKDQTSPGHTRQRERPNQSRSD